MNREDGDLYDQIMDDIAEDAATRDHERRVRGEDDTPAEEEPAT